MASRAKPSERKPRGEVAELTVTLQSLCTMGKRSPMELRTAKKDSFKKVINYMTQGMDMSPLFPTMISCANLSSDDIVLKKMLYLFITHYAQHIPDLALLAINQLHKDCVDQDPTVRGLALRSLCSLRVANFLEYVTSPINSGLEDRHPYVRRTAVMGVLKVYHIDPAVVHHQGMLERVKRMLLADSDAQVVANCLAVMVQVEGIDKLVDKVLIYNLLNRMKDFSEWAQCEVLHLVALYKPVGEQEVFDILNVLEDRMGVVNSAIVLATIKVFLNFTLSMPATHQQVLERIKDPLKSLIGRDDPATTYAVLSHVLLIVQRAPVIFEQEFVAFYCRTHEPWYVKRLKMEILTAIASASNVYEIVNELTEYARDIQPAMAREAVKAVGRIALAVPDVSGLLERLLGFLEAGTEHLTSEALVQMKDLLRRYPDLAELLIGQMGELNPAATSEPEAKAALVWIIGQFGNFIQDAPYLLEPLAETFASEAVAVRLALLTGVAQLFFRRPPETQKLLGSVLAAGMKDADQDVHDRALLYYRLLRFNPVDAERVISPPIVAIPWFSESLTAEVKERIFEEFDSLSVVFKAPASTFVEASAYHPADVDEEAVEAGGLPYQDGQEAAAVNVAANNATNLLADMDGLEGDLLDMDVASVSSSMHTASMSNHAASASGLAGLLDDFGPPSARPAAPPPAVAMPSTSSLLDMDDLLYGTSSSTAAAKPAGGPPAAVAPDLVLNPQARLAPAAFQDAWKSSPTLHMYSETLSTGTVAALSANNHKDFGQHMLQAYIMTMASGGTPPQYKYYFYSQEQSGGALLLVELVVRTDTCQATATFKSSTGAQWLPQYLELWANCLLGFSR